MQPRRGMPGGARAYVEERKVRDYLLSREHPDGRTKAAYFESFGFRVEAWQTLAEALLRHGALGDLVETTTTPFGVQYAVVGPLECPDGRRPTVRSVWEASPDDSGPGSEPGYGQPRLVTAYPGTVPRQGEELRT